jgi:transposase InsO family protein
MVTRVEFRAARFSAIKVTPLCHLILKAASLPYGAFFPIVHLNYAHGLMQSSEQQTKFDDFLEEFNNERPHQALDMKCPAEVYTLAARPYRDLPELHYPFHLKTPSQNGPRHLAAFIRTRRDLNYPHAFVGG